MEETKRRLRNFLICVVTVAVVIGVIYYFTDIYGTSDISEGTLVRDYSHQNSPITVLWDSSF